MKTIKYTLLLIVAVMMIAMLQPGTVSAQAKINGEATVSYLQFDDEGNRSSARELYDTYKGFNFQNLSAFGDLNPHTRYSLRLDDIGFDGRRAALNLTDINLYKLRVDYRQSRLLYGPGTESKNNRKFYSGSFEIKPHQMLSAFVNYQGYKNEGDRIVSDTLGTGLFGDKYDRTSSTISGGLKGKFKDRQLGVTYGKRTYDDKNNTLDSKTTFANVDYYCRQYSQLKIVIQYDYAQKKLDSLGVELKDNSFGLMALYRPINRLAFGPAFNYRAVEANTDAPKFSSYRAGLTLDYITLYGTTLTGEFGYEGRKTKNGEEVKSNVLYYSIGGRSRLNSIVAARVVYKGQNRKDPDKVLLTGVEDRTNVLAELEITPCSEGQLRAGYKLSNRENSDINTRAKVGSLYGTINRWFKDKAEFGIQGNITNVKYNWESSEMKYRYNSVTGTFSYNATKELTLSTGLAYFIFKKDVQQDKVDVTFGAKYQFIPRAKFGVSYRRYEFDNTFLASAQFRADLIKAELTVNLARD
jgi:hypothetical protein